MTSSVNLFCCTEKWKPRIYLFYIRKTKCYWLWRHLCVFLPIINPPPPPHHLALSIFFRLIHLEEKRKREENWRQLIKSFDGELLKKIYALLRKVRLLSCHFQRGPRVNLDLFLNAKGSDHKRALSFLYFLSLIFSEMQPVTVWFT